MNVLAFAASNSKHSINRTLAVHAAGRFRAARVEVLDINDYEMPIYSEDRERVSGQPQAARRFLERVRAADLLVIAFAEHNGSFSAAYKNLVDWASRSERRVFHGKPTLMLATSPGAGGGARVLRLAEESAQYFGADLRASLAVPHFHKNFDCHGNRLTHPRLSLTLDRLVRTLEAECAVPAGAGRPLTT